MTESCSTPEFHRTHKYCPSCSWTYHNKPWMEAVYQYDDPGHGVVTMTVRQILKEYFPSWFLRMAVHYNYFTLEACVKDWVTAHWAWRIDG